MFYDSLFTMKVTSRARSWPCMLVDRLITVPTVWIIMTNTDGLDYMVHPDYAEQARARCREWEQLTKLNLEYARYKRMFIGDCNNYIGQYLDGKVESARGAYEHDLEWHQNHSALVVPKVAEKVLLEGAPIRETVEQWPEMMDFMLRTMVPSVLVPDMRDQRIQNITRYYIAKGGGHLFKWMPPPKG